MGRKMRLFLNGKFVLLNKKQYLCTVKKNEREILNAGDGQLFDNGKRLLGIGGNSAALQILLS